jgi:hypothetical protein
MSERMKSKARLAGWYGVGAGVLILGQWSFFLLAGQVPELETEPIRIGFHLAAELATALALIAAGWAVLRSRAWGRPALLLALGMLIYTVVVSPGYFAQRGEWLPLGLFGLLLALALVCAGILLQRPANWSDNR